MSRYKYKTEKVQHEIKQYYWDVPLHNIFLPFPLERFGYLDCVCRDVEVNDIPDIGLVTTCNDLAPCKYVTYNDNSYVLHPNGHNI